MPTRKRLADGHLYEMNDDGTVKKEVEEGGETGDKVALVKPSPRPTAVAAGAPPPLVIPKGTPLGDMTKMQADHKKKVDAWLAKNSPAAFTAKDQSSAIRKKKEGEK